MELRSLPDRPTRGKAREATKRLYHLVRQFPFASDSDRAVWLAALLTAVQRPTIAGPVPGFAFNGNKAGIGKGLLIDTIGVLAWGHCIPTRTYPADPVEAGKVKLSLALAAIAAVLSTTCPRAGSTATPSSTRPSRRRRSAGNPRAEPGDGPVPLRPLWTLSGNNVSPSRDAYRRWLPSHLRTDLESPTNASTFEDRDLLTTVRTSRPDLLRDVLIILKAHAIAGHPRGEWAPVGSFEEWDQIIHGAVWYATDEDCLTTQRHAAANRPNGSRSSPSSRAGPSSRTGPTGASRSRRPSRPSRGTRRRIPCSTPPSCGSPRMGKCPASTGSATGSGPWAGRTTVG